jgi:hypothetical protein
MLALMVSFLVIGLHILASNLYLYWTYRQFDILMHILGGIMSGLFVLTGLRFMSWKEVFKNVIAGCLVIGFAWEILELVYKVQEVNVYYYFDTIKDLIDDCIGGLIALIIWKKLPEVKA